MNKILISGAGSGLGRALALRYARESAQVCVSDMSEESGAETVQLIKDAGGEAFFMLCDITKQWDVDKLCLQLTERWGSFDLLVNNAGVATAGMLEFESMEQWQRVLDINVLGHVRMTKAFLPLLKASTAPDKSVINIASQAGLTPAPGMGSYSVSKAAMISYSETAYLELAHAGIHVSVVCPAFFNTNLNTSLRSDQPGMNETVSKLIKKSGVTADTIAEQIFNHVADRKFMLITHKDGRSAHRLKRFLPIDRYLKIMKNRTKKFIRYDD
ncbi:MAG: NAD(P)-dependent dehydrogenase (short-subunit alcohol dehydrogenase family) [Dinoroseobacter sp.]|jgi:NAD(P)-dependent dehydrogenase (short-subunit alcohol dehydrogenase family)